MIGIGSFRVPTEAQGGSVTLSPGGNNVVYQGDALPVALGLGAAAGAVTRRLFIPVGKPVEF